MADTRAQQAAEIWIVEHALPALFEGRHFTSQKLELKWGGKFAFDAVSSAEDVVVCFSTSAAVTARGKQATAKIQKLKTDALYLLNIKKQSRIAMAFSELSMLNHFKKSQSAGRFPPEIELVHTPLLTDMQEQVLAARLAASMETSPSSDTKR
jgi:hypothetical protein